MSQKKVGVPVRNFHFLSTGTNGDYNVVSTLPTVAYGIQAFNISTGIIAYLKVYDQSTISSVTSTASGGTMPYGTWVIPFSVGPTTQAQAGGFAVSWPEGLNFNNGISFALVSGAALNSTSSVMANGVLVNLQHEASSESRV